MCTHIHTYIHLSIRELPVQSLVCRKFRAPTDSNTVGCSQQCCRQHLHPGEAPPSVLIVCCSGVPQVTCYQCFKEPRLPTPLLTLMHEWEIAHSSQTEALLVWLVIWYLSQVICDSDCPVGKPVPEKLWKNRASLACYVSNALAPKLNTARLSKQVTTDWVLVVTRCQEWPDLRKHVVVTEDRQHQYIQQAWEKYGN